MSDILFGVVWLIITSVIFISFFFSTRNFTSFFPMLPLILFFSLFYGIGFWMLYRGIKRMAKDKRTTKNGIFTYGRVVRVGRTGTVINGVPELKVRIAAYVPYTRSVQCFDEVIGLAPSKYKVGDYLILQWYKDDVNIIEKTMANNIPIDQREKIDDSYPISSPAEEVVIDGVKYRKVSDNNYASERVNNKFDSEW